MSRTLTHTEHEKLRETKDKAMFGLWIYLMTDLMLFASLFATYVVLRNNTASGPTEHEIFSLPFVFVETMLLLASSFVTGLAVLAFRRGVRLHGLILLGLTFLFGAGFLAMELYEFNHLIHEGHSWQASAFLSAFFALIGTHGLHILFGLLWLSVLVVLIVRRGFTPKTERGLSLFALFWHFLDIVWIFIFTIVYLMGVL